MQVLFKKRSYNNTDIKGANDYGWTSFLVRTGVWNESKPHGNPSFIVDHVGKAVEQCLDNFTG